MWKQKEELMIHCLRVTFIPTINLALFRLAHCLIITLLTVHQGCHHTSYNKFMKRSPLLSNCYPNDKIWFLLWDTWQIGLWKHGWSGREQQLHQGRSSPEIGSLTTDWIKPSNIMEPSHYNNNRLIWMANLYSKLLFHLICLFLGRCRCVVV